MTARKRSKSSGRSKDAWLWLTITLSWISTRGLWWLPLKALCQQRWTIFVMEHMSTPGRTSANTTLPMHCLMSKTGWSQNSAAILKIGFIEMSTSMNMQQHRGRSRSWKPSGIEKFQWVEMETVPASPKDQWVRSRKTKSLPQHIPQITNKLSNSAQLQARMSISCPSILAWVAISSLEIISQWTVPIYEVSCILFQLTSTASKTTKAIMFWASDQSR